MKKWFERNKDKIFIWVCVGLIAIIVLLFVLFQRNDVEQMKDNKDADIVLDASCDNLLKNDVSLFYSCLSYEDTFDNVSIKNSFFLDNENTGSGDVFSVETGIWLLKFDMSKLHVSLNDMYGLDYPSTLYFNFTYYIEFSDIVSITSWGSQHTYDFYYNYSSTRLIDLNDVNNFMSYNNHYFYSYPITYNYMFNNDYYFSSVSIPVSNLYEHTNDYFNIVLPYYDNAVGYHGGNSNDIFDLTISYHYYFQEENIGLSEISFGNNIDLQQKFDNLNSNYQVLQNENISLFNTNSQLEAANTQLSNTNSQLEATNTQLSNTNSQLLSDYNSLDANYNTLLSQYNTLLHQSDYSFSELFWSISAVPMGVLTSAFNVNVLGVNLRGIITGLFTALLLIWLFKKLF